MFEKGVKCQTVLSSPVAGVSIPRVCPSVCTPAAAVSAAVHVSRLLPHADDLVALTGNQQFYSLILSYMYHLSIS